MLSVMCIKIYCCLWLLIKRIFDQPRCIQPKDSIMYYLPRFKMFKKGWITPSSFLSLHARMLRARRCALGVRTGRCFVWMGDVRFRTERFALMCSARISAAFGKADHAGRRQVASEAERFNAVAMAWSLKRCSALHGGMAVVTLTGRWVSCS